MNILEKADITIKDMDVDPWTEQFAQAVIDFAEALKDSCTCHEHIGKECPACKVLKKYGVGE